MEDTNGKKLVIKDSNDRDELKKHGEKTYEENKVMALIADIMSDSKLRSLFDEHFNDWNDIKTILMIMKVYQSIENQGKNKLDKKELIGAVQKIIMNGDMRHNVVNAMDSFMNADFKQQKSIKNKKD